MTAIADVVAEILGHDGQLWETSEGYTFAELLRDYDGTLEPGPLPGWTAYRFPDGSAIVSAPEGWWAVAHRDCLCPTGIGHIDGCKAA